MILCMGEVLGAEQLGQVQALLEAGGYVEGATTAGWHARTVKRNLQLKAGEQAHDRAARTVLEALQGHELFRMGVLPQQVRIPLFSRYEPGMTYGTHVDDALMGQQGARARSDVAITLFISPPEAYEGGELVIEGTGGEQSYKLDAGALVAYPATSLHRVEPVRSGTRLVAVTWAQSLVREASRREILFDLDTARRTLFQQQGKTHQFDLISKSYANLLRLWAEP